MEDINKLQWARVRLIKDVEKALEVFTEMFLGGADKHAPTRKVTARKRKAPWINEELKAMVIKG